MRRNRLFYAQSGGMTSVINASAYGVIRSGRRYGMPVYAGKNGLLGALNGEFFDTTKEEEKELEKLVGTPGGWFGSCRYHLPDPYESLEDYRRIFGHFSRHEIGSFICNGGNDSQDTAYKMMIASQLLNYPLQCIGIPKTIDNDLMFTDSCPGYGSAAKFIANMVLEVDLDLRSMCSSSTKVFILEVMGRHTGWLAAASGLAREREETGPHIILVPESPFGLESFATEVENQVRLNGRCVVVVSEGVKNLEGKSYAVSYDNDSFGHPRLGGVAVLLAEYLKKHTGYKIHWAVASYLQRAARHLASMVDFKQALELGDYAVEMVTKGVSGYMVNLVRDQDFPYQYHLDKVELKKVANLERYLPDDFINQGCLTKQGKAYLSPLIQGEAPNFFKNGLLEVANLRNILAE